MSLYSDWTDIARMERTPNDQQAFWAAYFDAEAENYKKILLHHETPYTGTLAALAEGFDMDTTTFAGFLDGINTSLTEALELDSLTEESEIALNVDFDKLYYNMLDAKADWLYTLPEWEPILTADRRREITKEFRGSKIFVSGETVGRNDPCPCGSGKKYKKCCGKNQA